MPVSMTQEDLRVNMRSLWDEHVGYTHSYIVSAVANMPDADVIAQRLLRNQDDIGNAIVPFYGKEAGAKLTSLLREHIMIASDIVKYAKMNNKTEMTSAQNKWSTNAEQIATFLSGANPNWSKKDCADMLNQHLGYVADQLTARLNKQWSNDIKTYDQGHQHMMMFADFLSDGIAKQFPSMMAKE